MALWVQHAPSGIKT